jgi:hypothetical protein
MRSLDFIGFLVVALACGIGVFKLIGIFARGLTARSAHLSDTDNNKKEEK